MPNDVLTRLRHVVELAYNTSESSWYRDICTSAGIAECPKINAIDDIKTLPLLTRDMLAAVDFSERVLAPANGATEFRSTSGTTKQAPLFYLRNAQYHVLSKRMFASGARRRLRFWSHQFSAAYVEMDRQTGIQTIVCEPRQLKDHVPLVSHLSIDTLSGTPSVLMMFGAALKSFGTLQIRFLELEGEPCPASTVAALRKMFPAAQHFSQYSIGEVGREIGIRLPKCPEHNGAYYHLCADDLFVERVAGEMIVTCLSTDNVFPLLRYRTGDEISELKHDTCACGHDGISFRLLGRQNVDFVRISGVEIRHEEIQKIVATFSGRLEPFAAAYVRQSMRGGQQAVSLEVQLVPTANGFEDAERLQESFKHALTENLRLSATTFLHEMVKAGLFLEPKISFLAKVPVSNKAPGIKRVADG